MFIIFKFSGNQCQVKCIDVHKPHQVPSTPTGFNVYHCSKHGYIHMPMFTRHYRLIAYIASPVS